jgi:hypothetical protein
MPSECPVCGQSFGLTHNCPGAAAAPPPMALRISPGPFAVGYYLRLAFDIARFDGEAIVSASRDKHALLYGVVIWILLGVAGGIKPWIPVLLQGYVINWSAILVNLSIGLLALLAATFLQYAIYHGLARWWFGASGTYLGLVRAMFLSSLVSVASFIPVVGIPVASLWGVAILMRVFEEVDGIERMKAFALSAGLGIVTWILFLSLSPARRSL